MKCCALEGSLPVCRAQDPAHGAWTWGEDGGGALAEGGVIARKGNIFMLTHCRSHSAFMSETGNVLGYDITEAALSWQVH